MVDWNSVEVEVATKMKDSSEWVNFPKNQDTIIQIDQDRQPLNVKEGYEWYVKGGKKFTAGLTFSSLLIRAMKKSDGTVKVFRTEVKNSWRISVKMGENWVDVKSIQ